MTAIFTKKLLLSNSNKNFLYKSMIFLIFFYISIDENLTFVLLLLLVISFVFFRLSLEINLFSLFLIFFVVMINKMNFYKIEEKHNIFVPNKLNYINYTQFINQDDYLILIEQFLKSYKTKKNVCKNDEPSCWENLKLEKGISQQLNFFYGKNNYSRLVTKINHNNLAKVKINETNRLNLNFFEKNIFNRDNMPYFIIYKFPKFLIQSELCFKGYLILNNSLKYQNNKECIKILSTNKYLFFNFNHLEVNLKKMLKVLF